MQIRKMQYSKADNLAIDFEIEHPVYGWIPFTATPNDVEQHGRELFAKAIAGELGVVATYTPPPTVIPSTITMRQARLALLQLGLLDGVDVAINSITDVTQRKMVQIEWEYSNTMDRNSTWVENLASGLGLNEQQLDNLFVTASAM